MSTTLAPAALYLSHTATMLGREIRRTIRTVDAVVISLLVPVSILFAFVWVFGGAIEAGGGYINYVMPGLLMMCAGFGAAQTAVGVSQDMKSGVIDRFRTLPIAGSTVLAGHVLASIVRNLATGIVLFGCSLLLGFQPGASPLGALLAVGLFIGFVLAFTWIFCLVGMLLGPEAAGGVSNIMIFAPYVSSGFVDPATMPGWLQGFAEHQPFTPVIESMRAFLMGGDPGMYGWVAVAWCAGLAVIGWTGSAVVFRRSR